MKSYVDSIGILKLEDRLSLDLKKELVSKCVTMAVIYDLINTKTNEKRILNNIYITENLKDDIRVYKKIHKCNYEDATFNVCKETIKHEEMHKCIEETEGIETAMMYDVLLGGEKGETESASCTIFNKDRLLP